MEKMILCSYNKNSDELNISIGKPKKAVSLEIGKEIYVRLHPKTKEIIGFTILHFEERSAKKDESFALPLTANFKLPNRLSKELLTA